MHARLDLAEPAAPARRLAGLAGAGEVGGNRVTAAGAAQFRLEPFLVDIAGRLGRQDLAERRAEQAHRRAEARPGGFEEGAAFAHVTDNIFDIGLRDNAAPAIAVE